MVKWKEQNNKVCVCIFECLCVSVPVLVGEGSYPFLQTFSNNEGASDLEAQVVTLQKHIHKESAAGPSN